MMSPTLDTDVGVADFASAIDGVWLAGTEAGDGGVVTGGPVGGIPVAAALSLTLPLSRSANVTLYVPVHVSDWPATRVDCGQVGPLVSAPAGATWVSVTLTLV